MPGSEASMFKGSFIAIAEAVAVQFAAPAAAPGPKEHTTMLKDIDAAANIAVRNLETARRFYQDTLGLTPVGRQGEELITFRSGNSTLNVYRSQYAGSNQATAVTWAVDDVASVVRALKGKGVSFEHYDLPGARRDGDIHVTGDMKVAWFKDPDGNILNIAGG